jgi:hypothetical protein
MTALTMAEASKACGVLFGPQVNPSLEFFKYLQPSGLKAAYRKKALETHPDRAGAIGEDAAKMTGLFLEATYAYHSLLPIITSNGTIRCGKQVDSDKRRGYATAQRSRRETASDHFYAGTIPRRNLLIGQFLYYTGVISWQTLIDAVVWQRKQRPMIGQIALRWKKLSERHIQMILMTRQLGEKFGECAAREGYLTRFEVMALLGRQRRLQSPIGEYFLKRNLLRDQDLEHMVKRQQIHNRRIVCRSRF